VREARENHEKKKWPREIAVCFRVTHDGLNEKDTTRSLTLTSKVKTLQFNWHQDLKTLATSHQQDTAINKISSYEQDG